MSNQHSKEFHRKNYQIIRRKVLPKVEKAIIREVNLEIEKLIKADQLSGYLGLYWPINSEVDLRHFKTNTNIQIALPASNKDGQLTYHPWRNLPLIKDFCGIPAPINEPSLTPDQIALLLVPALAIDQNGYRLGYGGGFFDRLREKPTWRSIPSKVVLPKDCVSNSPFPHETWDVPFNGWINEKGVFNLF